MLTDKYRIRLELFAENGDRLLVKYDNRGEPFREGLVMELIQGDGAVDSVFLSDSDAMQLRDMLNARYPR